MNGSLVTYGTNDDGVRLLEIGKLYLGLLVGRYGIKEIVLFFEIIRSTLMR